MNCWDEETTGEKERDGDKEEEEDEEEERVGEKMARFLKTTDSELVVVALCQITTTSSVNISTRNR